MKTSSFYYGLEYLTITGSYCLLQTAVDDKYNLIAAFDVINSSADQGQLYNMAEKAKDKLGVEKIEVLADKGYYNL